MKWSQCFVRQDNIWQALVENLWNKVLSWQMVVLLATGVFLALCHTSNFYLLYQSEIHATATVLNLGLTWKISKSGNGQPLTDIFFSRKDGECCVLMHLPILATTSKDGGHMWAADHTLKISDFPRNGFLYKDMASCMPGNWKPHISTLELVLCVGSSLSIRLSKTCMRGHHAFCTFFCILF